MGGGGFAVAGGDLQGVGTVEQLHEGVAVHGEGVLCVRGGGEAPLLRPVHLFLHGDGVAVRVVYGIAHGEALCFCPQVGTGGAGACNGRGRVVVHGPGVAGGISAVSGPCVVGPDPVGYGGPAPGDGVGEVQGVAPEHLAPGSAVHLALQGVSAQVAVAVGGNSPGNGQAPAAQNFVGDGDTGRDTGRLVVDNRDLAAALVAGIEALAVIGPDPVHNAFRAKGDGVGGASGAALVDIAPGAAAVGTALQLVALQVAFGVAAGCPLDRDSAAAVDGARDGDASWCSRGRVRIYGAIVRD